MFLKRFQLGLVKLEPRSVDSFSTARFEAYNVKQMTSAITGDPVVLTFFICVLL